MGGINNFDINQIKNNYNLNYFVETGTGIGNSLVHALKITENNKFDIYYSVEISTSLYNKCLPIIDSHPNQNVKILNNNSSDGLLKILKEIPKDKNILFWLDAHFPDGDHNNASYGAVSDKKIRIPLEEEISIIKKHREKCLDYLIIDDLRIYEDGPYEGGNWKDRSIYGGNGIDFIIENFGKSHIIQKLYNHEGYIILIPKD